MMDQIFGAVPGLQFTRAKQTICHHNVTANGYSSV